MDLSLETFRAHLRVLGRRCEVVDLLDGLDRVATGEPLERDLVSISFDDGYREVYSAAWPELRRAGLPFTVFVATGFLDGDSPAPIRPGAAERGASPKALTWDQLGEMRESGLASVGSHTRTHRDFDTLSPAEAEAELASAREAIEHRTGLAPEVFAYPRAIVAHADIVARYHRYAVGGDGEKNVPGSLLPMAVSRTPVRASDGRFFFERRLDAIAPLEDRLYARLRGSGR
jgi:peptidoglycan/xylan/chitin deacetylase (PgdA/CDA1 family)